MSRMTCFVPVAALFRTLFHVAAFAVFSSVALAQLNVAHDDCYKPLQDYSSKLRTFAESEESRKDFDGIKSLAEKYVERLNAMAERIRAIGGQFSDSSNRSWASDVRGATLDAISRAKDKADALRQRADSKSDTKSETHDLQEALAGLSDRYRDLWKAHESRLKQLSDDQTAARDKWYAETKDDRKPLDEAMAQWNAIREKLDEISRKRSDSSKRFLAAAADADRARTDLHGARLTPDEFRSRYETYSRTFEVMLAAMKAADQLEKEVSDTEKALDAAWAKCQQMESAFEREFSEGNSLLNNELKAVILRAAEFVQEYRSFGL